MSGDELPRGPRIILTRAVMRSWPGHENCAACPHPEFQSYYADTGEPVVRPDEPVPVPASDLPA